MANFSANTSVGCGPLSVIFQDQSTGKPTSWIWDFGNGNTSNQQNPTQVYTVPGTYSVTLIIKSAGGVSSISKTDFITVYPYPVPNFKADILVGCAPTNTQFTDLSTPGQGSIVSYAWNFGDGGTSSAQNPSHTFTKTGYYSVYLTVVNSGGCSNSANNARYIRVVPGVQPDFTWAQSSVSCNAPFDINFTNQTSGPGTLSYSWDLGNGNTTSAKDPSATYPTNLNYTVKLTASSSLGCNATTTKTVNFQTRKPLITAPDSACVNDPVNFVNSSSPQPISSSWDFGDATTASIANPSKAYGTPANYTVTLTNNYGSCTASATRSIKIVNTPAVNFSATNTTSCKAGLMTAFTDLTPGAMAWLWNFGDGSTSTLQNPSHTYTSQGNYDVSLTVTTATGCSGTLKKPAAVRIAPPTIAFNGGNAQGCVNQDIHPSAGGDIVDGIATYAWSSTGNPTATGTNTASPTFNYSAQGNYDMTLTITTNGGCSATTTVPGWVIIGTPTAAIFTQDPSDDCAHQPITFRSTSSPVDTWIWEFGDGSSAFTGPTAQHKYNDPGPFNVKLSVNHHGCIKSYTLPTPIKVNPPKAGFRYLVDCADKHKVNFTDTSIVDNTQPINIKWNFGDGGGFTDFTPNPIHNFPAFQPYHVTEIVQNGACTDTTVVTIDLSLINVTISAAPTSPCKNTTFTMTGNTSSPVGSYSWDIAGPGYLPGYTQPSASPNYSTSLPDTGAYTISLQVIDLNQCPYPVVTKVVQAIGPSAKFTGPFGGCTNTVVTFTEASTSYPGSNILTRTWEFGDGSVNTLLNTHIYKDTGSYMVRIAVTDNHGCKDTSAAITNFHITSAHAGFFAADTLYCPGTILPFTDTSRGANLTYSWAFGDGNTNTTDQNPSNTYPATNDQYYDVKLKVTDGSGCSDSLTRAKYIHTLSPIAAFDMQDSTAICVPLQTTFLPNSQFYDSLSWDFGDGSTSGLDTTTHFYNDYDKNGKPYTVTLYAQGAGGCKDSAKRFVNIYEPFSNTTFTFGPVSQCDSIHADFNITPPPFTSFTLYFGDGLSDSSSNHTPSHSYYSPVTYSPQLALQDSTGCIVSINRGSITVLGSTPIFNLDNKKFCDSGTVFFSGYAISDDHPFTATWDFGDGSSGPGRYDDISQDTTHFFSNPGDKLIKLNIITSHGCKTSYTDTAHIYQTPHPAIGATGAHCTGLLQFQGSLTLPDTDSIIWAWTFSDGQNAKQQNPSLTFKAGNLTAHLQTSVDFGCKDTTSTIIEVYPLPQIKGPAEVTTPLGFPVTLPFTYSPDINTWSWTPSTNLNCTDCSNPMASPIFNTLYTVSVTDTNNCTSTGSILVSTICNAENYFVPNTFSPNNDGVNDVFYPRGKSLYNIQSMRVFNRWGQMVFERKNFPANTSSMGWDGTFNGRAAPSDVYIYIVEVICDNAQIIALKGDITLIR